MKDHGRTGKRRRQTVDMTIGRRGFDGRAIVVVVVFEKRIRTVEMMVKRGKRGARGKGREVFVSVVTGLIGC